MSLPHYGMKFKKERSSASSYHALNKIEESVVADALDVLFLFCLLVVSMHSGFFLTQVPLRPPHFETVGPAQPKEARVLTVSLSPPDAPVVAILRGL